MRSILILSNTFDSLIRFRLPLIEALIKAKCVVHCAAPLDNKVMGADLQILKDLGVKIYPIKMAAARIAPLSDCLTCWEIYQLVQKVKPDTLFCYTIKPNTFGIFATKLAKPNCRIVALMNGMGLTLIAGSLKQKVLGAFVRLLYKASFAMADRVFFHNQHDQQEFISLNLVNPNKSGLVPGSGIDLQKFQALPVPPSPLHLLFIGRVIREKGIFEFIEAAKEIKKLHQEVIFTVLGPIYNSPTAVSSQQIEQWQNSGLIRYAGSAEQIETYLAAAHVVVLPSYREGLSRALLEAMACARAIIATDVPGCAELVQDGVSGFLVPARNSMALIEAFERCLSRFGDLAIMGQEGRKLVESKYSSKRMIEILLPALMQ